MRIDDPLSALRSLRPMMNESSDKSKNADELGKNRANSADSASQPTGAERARDPEDAKLGTVDADTDSYVTSRPESGSPIRQDKVEQARRRIESGAYDMPAIRDAIVDKLVDALTE